jgi:hypothetical protein
MNVGCHNTTSFALFASLLCALGGCNSSSPSAGSSADADNGSCPPPVDVAWVDPGCSFAVPPTVKTTGPCTGSVGVTGVDLSEPSWLVLTASAAGTCQVELTFETGTTTTFNVDFVSVPPPLDGCNYAFIAVNDAGSQCVPSACVLSIPAPTCDAGLDAEPSD